MARINIEDSLFKDQRWSDLLIKTGCQLKAIGIIASTWILAEQHWLEYGCVPKKAWNKKLDLMIEVELATVLDNGDVYVKGSKRAFAWLEQRQSAGQKGGRPKKSTESGRLSTESGSNPLPLSLPLSPTISKEIVVGDQQPQKQMTNILARTQSQSSTQNFHARFQPDLQKWEDVLDEYGLLKRLRRYLGQIINSFDSPDQLNGFIHLKATCPAAKKIMQDAGQNIKAGTMQVESFVLVCIKREIGVLSENT